METSAVEVERGGPADLQPCVLGTGSCTACGACLGHCPYLKTLGERVAFIHPCPLPEGRCFAVCPRAALAPDRLDAPLGRPTAAPHPVVARDRAAVLAAAGTKYSACATLAPLAPLLREGTAPLAVVGRPCQVAALRKIEARGGGV